MIEKEETTSTEPPKVGNTIFTISTPGVTSGEAEWAQKVEGHQTTGKGYKMQSLRGQKEREEITSTESL